MHGRRHESRWTIKAWKAWGYVDRFLMIEDLLPTITQQLEGTRAKQRTPAKNRRPR
jgi:hypothetical protein